MAAVLRGLALILIVLNLIFASWYVSHNDFYFYTDIARDLLLLEELDAKKIVLIGPRASASGVFHGPLWLYLSYPGFLIGQGSPFVLGWYWIALIAAFLISSFIVAKKLFTETVAWLFILFLSLDLAFDARALFNPHGAYFLMPLFFFLFVRYLQKQNVWYLAILYFVIGCIIQFQMAVGVPLLFLSSIPLLVTIYQKRKAKHLLALFTIVLSLSPFILFELTHDFIQIKASLLHVFSDNLDTKTYTNYWGVITDRIHLMTTQGIGLLTYPYSAYHPFIALAILVLSIWQIKKNNNKVIYLSFLYFYCGYFIFSVLNKSGGVLPHHYMPLFPLIALIVVSFITVKNRLRKLLIWIGIGLIYYLNFISVQGQVNSFKDFTEINQISWKTIYRAAEEIYKGKEKEIGYFVYMPDSLAYQPKYAMSYANKQHPEIISHYFQKKPVTYLLIAPPPPSRPEMKDEWWRINQVRITKKPESVVTFPNGYKVEKYFLTEEEIAVPFDPSIDTGIHFR